MNLMEHNYRDNRDNVLHYRDIGILIIAQPYYHLACTKALSHLHFHKMTTNIHMSK